GRAAQRLSPPPLHAVDACDRVPRAGRSTRTRNDVRGLRGSDPGTLPLLQLWRGDADFVNSKSKIKGPKPPFVLVNMAMTANGKIATANRAVSSFGSARDHEHLLELRATADALMAGARTVDSAPINLGPGPAKFRRLRLRHGLAEYNLRIIVSGSGFVNPKAEVFRHRFSPIIVLTTKRASQARLRQLRTIADEVKVFGRDEISFPAALSWLRGKWGVKRLLCEGGGELNDALFRAGLVDEL